MALGNLHNWATQPDVAFSVGLCGLIATLAGVALGIRASRVAADANRQLAESIVEARQHIIKGVTDVFGVLPATTSPKSEGSAEPVAARPQSKPPPSMLEASQSATTIPINPDDAPNGKIESVGTADITRDGSPDLLVEQREPDRCVLRIFSWREFDLVLIGELANSTGAHFHLCDVPEGVIITLDRISKGLVERRFEWNGQAFDEEQEVPSSSSDRFFALPSWISRSTHR